MTLVPAQDFYGLRREGIGHIERAGSAAWTDYNTHDPGISILEAVAYAITELAYRTGFPIADLLASRVPEGDDPYRDQAFPSARTILTVNPTTVDDLRRLLIDVDPVRNAWVRCKECACDTPIYAWCEDDGLVLSHDPSRRPADATDVVTVEPRGLYDVLLELESDPTVGDLNDRKVVRRRTLVDDEGRRHVVTVELRLPAWSLARRDERRHLAEAGSPLHVAVLGGLNRTRTGTAPVDDAELRSHWNELFFVDLAVQPPGQPAITIENASVRLFGNAAVRERTGVADLLGWFADPSPEGFIEPYCRKLAAIDRAIDTARATFAAHRNLDEDVCHVDLVEIDEIAVCADVEIEGTADIELVQAQVWFEVERYLDPPVEFWSVDELRAHGQPVEAIFNGPELHNGFLAPDGLRDPRDPTEIRVSDLLDRLLDIEGVISVEGLRLTAYDAEGSPIQGIADPTWNGGTPVFEPDRTSAAWLLFLASGRRPRLHRKLSKFLFASNGLPFVPRLDEAEDLVVELHGRAARPKLRDVDLDLPLPVGRRRQVEAYHPVQHSFPQVYGIGPAGLPSTATVERHAQAQQLKAYLMVFEQLLRNAYAQVGRVGDLFSLDPDVDHTYFSAALDGTVIRDLDEIVAGLPPDALATLVETRAEADERRNRFLDHLLARFGEHLGDYAMALTDLEGHTAARTDLIDDKLAFLRALPRTSHDRGKAFNRAITPSLPDNVSGLQQRTHLLLGLPDLTFAYRARRTSSAPGYTHTLTLDQRDEAIVTLAPGSEVATAIEALLLEQGLAASATSWTITFLDGRLVLTVEVDGRPEERDLLGPGSSPAASALAAELTRRQRAHLTELSFKDRYRCTADGTGWKVAAHDSADAEIAVVERPATSRRDADRVIAELIAWSAHKRAIIVEHLLLRPKFPGDAIAPVCADGPSCGCGCGDEDPYSFRLTYVMPGWTSPFSTNLRMRQYAERTIQEQTPSHLIVKTCWVGTDGLPSDPCDPPDEPDPSDHAFERFEAAWCAWVDAEATMDWAGERLQDTVLELLVHGTASDAGHDVLCRGAAAILAELGTHFRAWMDANLATGAAFADFTPFAPPATVTLPPGVSFAAGTGEAIRALLHERYSAYAEVSLRLHHLVHALADLRNTYPRATLHDCDEGSDFNPVRLGQTALGSN